MEMNDAPPLGVYVHWPYCARICPYCDFNVHKNKGVDAGRWASAFVRDLEYWAARAPKRALTSLYFGGGTPSLMPIPVVEALIDACAALWGFKPDAEITLEVNPTDAEQSAFKAFARAGVNRLSLGVQSFDDAALRFLGRGHDATQARRAIETAQRGFERMSFDLIYARPDQSTEAWRAELQNALSFRPAHLSLYPLTIEAGTAFAKAVEAGRWRPPDEDVCAAQFDLAQDLTSAAGLPAYEISNHASPGEESRHNLLYWRYHDYIGVGPGAHGRLTIGGNRIATETRRNPKAYLTSVDETGGGVASKEILDDEAQLIERLAMGFRLSEGVSLYADDYFYADNARVGRMQRAIDDGLVSLECGRLRATRDGRRVLDRLLFEIVG